MLEWIILVSIMMVLKCDNHLSNSDEDNSEINIRSNKRNIAHYHYQNQNHITSIISHNHNHNQNRKAQRTTGTTKSFHCFCGWKTALIIVYLNLSITNLKLENKNIQTIQKSSRRSPKTPFTSCGRVKLSNCLAWKGTPWSTRSGWPAEDRFFPILHHSLP